jgi:hypothetical protein
MTRIPIFFNGKMILCGAVRPSASFSDYFSPSSLLPPLALLVPSRRSPTPTPPPPSPARAFPPQSPSSSRRPLPPAAADRAATRFMVRSGPRDAMAPARDQMSSAAPHRTGSDNCLDILDSLFVSKHTQIILTVLYPRILFILYYHVCMQCGLTLD